MILKIMLKLRFLIPAGLVLLLPACSMDVPTTLTHNKAQVIEEMYRAETATAELDNEKLKWVASDYRDKGAGPISVTVTYNPKSKDNTASRASGNAARIAAVLRKEGRTEVNTEILPIHNSDSSKTLLNYVSYRAEPPKGCNNFEDIDDTVHEDYRKYELGCSTESYLAQQVARPADLLGRGAVREELGARKHANNLEGYKWGANLIEPEEVETEDTRED